MCCKGSFQNDFLSLPSVSRVVSPSTGPRMMFVHCPTPASDDGLPEPVVGAESDLVLRNI